MQEDFDGAARDRDSSLQGRGIEDAGMPTGEDRRFHLQMNSPERSKEIKQWVLILVGLAAMAWGFVMMRRTWRVRLPDPDNAQRARATRQIEILAAFLALSHT